MAAPELYLLFKFTGKFEYPLAVSVGVLAVFFNIVVFLAFFSVPFCTILIVIIDIMLLISLLYLYLDKRKHKKIVKTKD